MSTVARETNYPWGLAMCSNHDSLATEISTSIFMSDLPGIAGCSSLPHDEHSMTPVLESPPDIAPMGQAESAPAPSPRASLPRMFQCPICRRLFDRKKRAEACRDEHKGFSRYPCSGKCGKANWYAPCLSILFGQLSAPLTLFITFFA